MGMRIYSDVAIDDFSLSPECFGLNIPTEHLQGYNYYDQRILQDKTPHEDFANRTGIYFQFVHYLYIVFQFIYSFRFEAFLYVFYKIHSFYIFNIEMIN